MDKAVAELMDGLYRLRLHACANIIIVSNHGLSSYVHLYIQFHSPSHGSQENKENKTAKIHTK